MDQHIRRAECGPPDVAVSAEPPRQCVGVIEPLACCGKIVAARGDNRTDQGQRARQVALCESWPRSSAAAETAICSAFSPLSVLVALDDAGEGTSRRWGSQGVASTTFKTGARMIERQGRAGQDRARERCL